MHLKLIPVEPKQNMNYDFSIESKFLCEGLFLIFGDSLKNVPLCIFCSA